MKDGASSGSQRETKPYLPVSGRDLLGPIEYQGTVNKRQVGKGWGVMFVCSATSAVHVEFYGHILNRQLSDGPTSVHVHGRSTIKNPVRQRRTASGSVKAADSLSFQRGSRMGREEWHEWHLVPTGGQHFNRHAERMVGILKKQLHFRDEMYGDVKCWDITCRVVSYRDEM
jgi:hypothetical protein